MEFFKKTPQIRFMARRKWCYAISLVLIVGTAALLAVRGLNFGLDFTGGVIVELDNPAEVSVQRVREALDQAGYRVEVQGASGGSRELIVRVPPQEGQTGQQNPNEVANAILETLKAVDAGFELRGSPDYVGAQVGRDLTEQGGLAMLFCFIGILIYVAFRFEWKMAAGTVIAAIHDAVGIFGFFALTQMTFDLSVLAAILAVIGYSINDTVVVFDRVREVLHTKRKMSPSEMLDVAINQTLSRTLMTSFSTLFVVGSLYVLAGETLRGFSMAIIVGVVVGTYSSIFIAAAVALDLKLTAADLMPQQKEKSELDALP
ncbi:MAG TPA: protein translocase subunit SecF [Steroidobacteraceae bacterium]